MCVCVNFKIKTSVSHRAILWCCSQVILYGEVRPIILCAEPGYQGNMSLNSSFQQKCTSSCASGMKSKFTFHSAGYGQHECNTVCINFNLVVNLSIRIQQVSLRIVASTHACHAWDRSSILRGRDFFSIKNIFAKWQFWAYFLYFNRNCTLRLF